MCARAIGAALAEIDKPGTYKTFFLSSMEPLHREVNFDVDSLWQVLGMDGNVGGLERTVSGHSSDIGSAALSASGDVTGLFSTASGEVVKRLSPRGKVWTPRMLVGAIATCGTGISLHRH